MVDGHSRRWVNRIRLPSAGRGGPVHGCWDGTRHVDMADISEYEQAKEDYRGAAHEEYIDGFLWFLDIPYSNSARGHCYQEARKSLAM